jgi:hypothetical protein
MNLVQCGVSSREAAELACGFVLSEAAEDPPEELLGYYRRRPRLA